MPLSWLDWFLSNYHHSSAYSSEDASIWIYSCMWIKSKSYLEGNITHIQWKNIWKYVWWLLLWHYYYYLRSYSILGSEETSIGGNKVIIIMIKMFHKRFFLLHSFHLIVYIWLCFKILSHIPYTSEICKTKAFGTSVLEKEQYKVHLIYLRHLPISSFSITYLFAPIYVFSFTFSILIHKQSTLFVHSMLLVRCGDVLVPI